MFLYFDPTTDFPVDLEYIYKDLGFANKGNAMKTLESNFTKNEDYKIVKFTNKITEDCLLVRTEKQTNRGGHNRENVMLNIDTYKMLCMLVKTPQDYKTVLFHREKNLGSKDLGGRPEEQIMLNIDTYKMLCMLVKTPQGKEIRKYYVKLENIYNNIIKKEIENKDKLLEENKQELENKENLLQESSKQLLKLQKFKTKKWFDQEPGDTVYAIKMDSGMIKLGKSKKIQQRESRYISDNVGDMFYIKKCYNCDLTEKVLHHMLDKFRVENNREFVNVSENLQEYKIKEFLDKASLNINFNNDNIKIEEPLLNKVVNIESNEDVIKKFIDESCDINEDYYVLSYEILGAYRLWSRGFNQKDRTYFTQYMKKYFKSKKKYYKEYDQTYLLVYLGIKPKDLIVIQEIKDILPKYEEFVLSECKYNYTYRIRYTDFINEYTKWYSDKYPGYIFSKEEKVNMEAYINRHFLKDKINMPGHKNVPGIWGIQLKSDESFRVGTNPATRKIILKIDSISKKIIEEYKSVIMASEKLNLDRQTIRNLIKNKKVKDNYILDYKNNIDLIE